MKPLSNAIRKRFLDMKKIQNEITDDFSLIIGF